MAALAAATLRSCPPLHSENLQPACASHWPADQATLPGDRRPGVFAVSIFRSQHHRDQQRWLEYYLLLGVTHFVLVDNNCDSTHARHATQTLAPYVDRGLVTHFTGFRCAKLSSVSLENLLKRGCTADESAAPVASCELCRSDVIGKGEINGYRKREMSPKSAALSCALSQVGLRNMHRNSLVLLLDDDEYITLRMPQYRLPDLGSMLFARRQCAMPVLWRQYGSSGFQCQPAGGNVLKHFLKRAPAASELTTEKEMKLLDKQKRLATRYHLNQPVKGKTIFLASALGCTTHICTSCPSGFTCGYGNGGTCSEAEEGFEKASNASFDRDVWIAHYSYQSAQHFEAKIERGRTNDNDARTTPPAMVESFYNSVHDDRPWRLLNARIHALGNLELRSCLSSLFEAEPASPSWMDTGPAPSSAATSSAPPLRGTEAPSSQPPGDTGCAVADVHLRNAVGPVRTSTEPLIIAAGEGTTATRSLGDALGQLGIWSAHNGRIISPPDTPAAEAARVQLQLQHLIRDLYLKPPAENAGFDFAGLAGHRWGAIMDTPVPIYLPWLLKAFPQAKIILTLRNPLQWAKSRYVNHEYSPAPLHGLYHGVGYEPKKFANVTVRQHQTVSSVRMSGGAETPTDGQLHQIATAFAMYNTFVACAVRSPQTLLLLDIFTGCSEELWTKITTFLGMNHVDVSKLPSFPGGSPSCATAGSVAVPMSRPAVPASSKLVANGPRQGQRRRAISSTVRDDWLPAGRTVLFVHVSGAGGTSMVAWARAAGMRVPISDSLNANEACGDESEPNAHHYSWAGLTSNTSRCRCSEELGMRNAGFNFWSTESLMRAPLHCALTDYWIILRRPVARIMSRLTKLESTLKGVPLRRVIESLKSNTRFTPEEYGKSEFSGTPAFDNWLVRSLAGPAVYDLPLGAINVSHLQIAMRVINGFSVVLPTANLTLLPKVVSARYGQCLDVQVPSVGGANDKAMMEKLAKRRARISVRRLRSNETRADQRLGKGRGGRARGKKRGKTLVRKEPSATLRSGARRLGELSRGLEGKKWGVGKRQDRKMGLSDLQELATLLLRHNRFDEQLYAYATMLFQTRLAQSRDPCK